jgi:hypothetical protein
MFTLPKCLLLYLGSFLNPRDYLNLRAVCKQFQILTLNHFRLGLNDQKLPPGNYYYINYTGNNYGENLKGCTIRKLRLTTEAHNKFDRSTHFEFLDLTCIERVDWIINDPLCKRIKVQALDISVISAAKVYTRLDYLKVLIKDGFQSCWSADRVNKRNVICRTGYQLGDPKTSKKLKTMVVDFDLGRIRKLELYFTQTTVDKLANLTYLRVYHTAPPVLAAPNLEKLKIDGCHYLITADENYIINLNKLKFIKVRNSNPIFYRLKHPPNLRVFKAVVLIEDCLDYLENNTFSAKIIIKKNMRYKKKN